MIYQFVQNGRSAHFDIEYDPINGSYDKGLLNLETWTCETVGTILPFEKYEFRKQCIGERGSRGLLVVVWLSSIALLGSLIWDFRTAQVVIGSKGQDKSGWEDEGWN